MQQLINLVISSFFMSASENLCINSLQSFLKYTDKIFGFSHLLPIANKMMFNRLSDPSRVKRQLLHAY